MSADRRRLLRQLEARMRQRNPRAEIHRQLNQAGMTDDDIWKFECTVRRRIRAERAGRHHNAQEAA